MYSAQIRCLRFSCCYKSIMGRKLFFFTDSPSCFPNSGNNRLRAGYADETRDCHTKIKDLIVSIWQSLRQVIRHTLGALMPLARKTYEGLPIPEKQFLQRCLPAAWKIEFELGGINHIRPFPELGALEILSGFSSGNIGGKAVKTMVSHKNFHRRFWSYSLKYSGDVTQRLNCYQVSIAYQILRRSHGVDRNCEYF